MAIPTGDNRKKAADSIGIPPFIQTLLGMDSTDPTNINVGMAAPVVGAVNVVKTPAGEVIQRTEQDIIDFLAERWANSQYRDQLVAWAKNAMDRGALSEIWDVSMPNKKDFIDLLPNEPEYQAFRDVKPEDLPYVQGVYMPQYQHATVFRHDALGNPYSDDVLARNWGHEVGGHAAEEGIRLTGGDSVPYGYGADRFSNWAAETIPGQRYDTRMAHESDYPKEQVADFVGDLAINRNWRNEAEIPAFIDTFMRRIERGRN
jgi:hypothetical protein